MSLMVRMHSLRRAVGRQSSSLGRPLRSSTMVGMESAHAPIRTFESEVSSLRNSDFGGNSTVCCRFAVPGWNRTSRTLYARKLPFGGDQPRSSHGQSDPPSLRAGLRYRYALPVPVFAARIARRTPVPPLSLRARTPSSARHPPAVRTFGLRNRLHCISIAIPALSSLKTRAV